VAVFRRGRIWWYDFRFKGVRIRESTSAITRAEALQAEAIRRAELAQGKALIQKSEPSPRFADFAYGEFARWCANEHKDHPSTYARYMCSVKALAQFFGNKSLEMIDSGAVRGTSFTVVNSGARTLEMAGWSARLPLTATSQSCASYSILQFVCARLLSTLAPESGFSRKTTAICAC